MNRAILLTLVCAVSACSPALNWREVRAAGSGVQMDFPCKPELQSRAEAHMGLARCEAAGLEFSLSWAELPDPSLAGAALARMRDALARKLGGPADAPLAFSVTGMTPHAEAMQQRVKGTRPARLAVFAKGAVVYQVVMSGPKPNADAWESFSSSIRLLDGQR